MKLKDARSGSTITIQNSEVKEISNDKYKASLAAPAPSAAPAAAPAPAPAPVPAPTRQQSRVLRRAVRKNFCSTYSLTKQYQSLKLTWARGVSTRIGSSFDTSGVAWQWIWF